MDEKLRIENLKEIQKTKPEMEGIRVTIKGNPEKLPAFLIPLSWLIYNKDNGRIASYVKSFETQNRELNPENEEDKKVIERFLWESKEDRNQRTMDDLVENGQRVYGIVTFNGKIIDGNRRAMLLNKIYSEKQKYQKHNLENRQYFLAVILPEGADKKTVLKLETEYQMGQDDKLDYNPIEKYLKCKDLKAVGYNEIESGSMMGKSEKEIKECLEIMKLMDDYLENLNYTGIYTRLDKTEDPFINLSKALKKFKNNNANTTLWNFDDMDINELKFLSFDYIRSRYEGKEFRDILNTNKKGIFSKDKELWNSFLNKHKEIVNGVAEIPVEQMRKENPGLELPRILRDRDETWANDVSDSFQKNLQDHDLQLLDLNERDMPIILIKRALNTIKAINTETAQFFESEVKDRLEEIDDLVSSYMEKHLSGQQSGE